MILAIETSTPVCSVALGKPGGAIIEKRIEGRGVHSESTFTFIQELLQNNDLNVQDLEAILFSNGPGSYTGLRIGAAAIKGLLFGRNVPLYTLSSLLSFSVPLLSAEKRTIHSVIDARREHLYHQKIERINSADIHVSIPAVREIEVIKKEIMSGDVIIGTGWDRLDVKKNENITFLGKKEISAKNLIIGWDNESVKAYFKQQNAESFEPDYLTLSQINNSAIRE